MVESRRPPRTTLLLTVLAVLFVVVPFLFWQQTWFGKPLSEDELEEYLHDDEHPRHIQHALSQIADRMVAGDASARKWYPRISEIAGHASPKLRSTAAWVMGQDTAADFFRQRLADLLEDADPMVRRNAALSLVRFGDARGRDELRAMLEPYTARAGAAGVVEIVAAQGKKVGANTLVARVGDSEVRSPYAGNVRVIHVAAGTTVRPGDAILDISPSDEQAWEALRALYLVGRSEDLELVSRYAQGVEQMPSRVQQQAQLTARAIQER